MTSLCLLWHSFCVYQQREVMRCHLFTFARILAVLILSTLLAFISGTLFAAQVTLTWDAVTGQSISGYKIYYGTTSRNYTASVDAKNVTSLPVTGLQDGTTYYFAATVYTEAKAESDFQMR